jgi:hypothetical protein
MARQLEIGWTFRVTIAELYPFQENKTKLGVKLRVEVLTMAHGRTAARQKRQQIRRADRVQRSLKD